MRSESFQRTGNRRFHGAHLMALHSRSQRSLLILFLVAIGTCGALGAIALLFGQGSDFLERILASTAAVAAASILALAAAVPTEARRWRPIGPVGLVLTSVTLGLWLFIIWADFRWYDHKWLMKLLIVLSALSVAVPHAGLLAMARLHRGYEWARRMTLIGITALVGLLISVVVFEIPESDVWGRLMGALAIAATCGTIAVPIFHRMSRIRDRAAVEHIGLSVSLVCPRCGTSQAMRIGRSQCIQCRLHLAIAIEEEQCAQCGYPLFGLSGASCPECGAPIVAQAAGPNPAPTAQDTRS